MGDMACAELKHFHDFIDGWSPNLAANLPTFNQHCSGIIADHDMDYRLA